MTPPQAFKEAGYTSEKTNAYRLENRDDIQSAIADYQKRRAELLTAGEDRCLKAEDLSDASVTQSFLMQTLLDALAQAKTMGDPRTVLAITTKLADLLALKFDTAIKKAPHPSASSILKKLEELT
ncbi:hypothetical protein FVA81_06615 [Rhizobium sp. WL3]|uniref:hypothetical protein n=1 Tax=Rhizobium sp. WL3 TaxID=2603277 RepID=UPI0011C20BE0|nr:hypothetical protein [Rhizobium sp. WL3]QEE44307.1 hypothetical protein FVA81_06615 [Rhizobium sp. WL3]